jgi:hypothetical protein
MDTNRNPKIFAWQTNFPLSIWQFDFTMICTAVDRTFDNELSAVPPVERCSSVSVVYLMVSSQDSFFQACWIITNLLKSLDISSRKCWSVSGDHNICQGSKFSTDFPPCT